MSNRIKMEIISSACKSRTPNDYSFSDTNKIKQNTNNPHIVRSVSGVSVCPSDRVRRENKKYGFAPLFCFERAKIDLSSIILMSFTVTNPRVT